VKKLLIILILSLLISTNVYADKKSSFADTLRNRIYAIDDAWWSNNNLSASIEVNGTWSGADTYRLAELICGSLKDQGFAPISSYSVTMVEVTGRSKLATLGCK
jgi:hypothetical protein